MIDFDGTIVIEDSLDLLFSRFADPVWVDHDRAWERGEIGSRDNLTFAFSTFILSTEKMEEVIAALTVSPGFFAFLEWIEYTQGYCTIISEGIDFIITRTLARNLPKQYRLGERIEIRANRFAFGKVEFAYNHGFCPHKDICKGCSLCKFRVVNAIEGYERVYVGDGLSDRFGILSCDVIYARDKLLDYCTEQKLVCHPFRSFADILELESKRCAKPICE